MTRGAESSCVYIGREGCAQRGAESQCSCCTESDTYRIVNDIYVNRNNLLLYVPDGIYSHTLR